jgi:hypothetical protein
LCPTADTVVKAETDDMREAISQPFGDKVRRMLDTSQRVHATNLCAVLRALCAYLGAFSAGMNAAWRIRQHERSLKRYGLSVSPFSFFVAPSDVGHLKRERRSRGSERRWPASLPPQERK